MEFGINSIEMDQIVSPLTHETNISLQRKIDSKKIISRYKRVYDVDVSPYFTNIDYVSIYKCNKTDYRFYYPFNISGDSEFYEHFQQFEWYYMPWKWEHSISENYLADGFRILEVGCAHGAYLERISKKFDLDYAVGLELNESTVSKNEGWEIKNESIQSFSDKNTEKFDLVCSYQVLEHISKVKTFIDSKIKCIKKGGILILSVPNNNSKVVNINSCLNNPPHHMGLWDKNSLKKLEKLFPLKLLDIHFEPLQEYHVGSYVNSTYYSKYRKFLNKVLKKIHQITGKYEKRYQEINSKRQDLIGHSILAAYQKK